MARIRSGILGNVRGKVSGVVGSQWKDKNYLREYIKPANPNTAAQQVQRALMSSAVSFCKALVGPIFNTYTDKFQKSMSGFNFFIKSNIALFTAVPTYASVLISEGKLNPLATLATTYNTADGETILTWDKNLGNNGADTDEVFGVLIDTVSGIWYFFSEEIARVDETETLTLPTGLTAGNLRVYVLAAKYVGTIVDMISNSVYSTVQAP